MTVDSRHAASLRPNTASTASPTGSSEVVARSLDASSSPDAEPERPRHGNRLASIDALRGFTILGMLLVNNISLGKATPQQLMHAGWAQGIHFADLVFPWFLLLTGLSIPLAAWSHRRRDLDASAWVVKVLTRTGVLLILGCLVDSSIKGYLHFTLGVLQLIGLSYGVAALVAHLSQPKRLALAAGLFVLHTAVLLLVPFGDPPQTGLINAENNFVFWLNENYLKPVHLEGLFSVFSTSALVIVGTVMGDALRREEDIEMREIGYLLASGMMLWVCGKVFGRFELYSKPLWTSSYLMVTGGYGLMLLALLRVAIDLHRYTLPVYPFLVFGANAITVYVVPILIKMLVLEQITTTVQVGKAHKTVNLMMAYRLSLTGWCGSYTGGWVYTLSYIGFWWVVLLLMYRKKIFVRV
jgi:predicted acyltransferase